MLQNDSVLGDTELTSTIVVYCVGVFEHEGLVLTVEDSQPKGNSPEFGIEDQDFQELQEQFWNLGNMPGTHQFMIGQVYH